MIFGYGLLSSFYVLRFFILDGEFAGTCASNNPMLNEEGAACGLCGARPDEQCKKDDLPAMPEPGAGA